jgi:hypothetical protein
MARKKEKMQAVRLFFRELEDGLPELGVERNAVGFGLFDELYGVPVVFRHKAEVGQFVAGAGLAGVYRPRHPERTVLYRILFHYSDQFLTDHESHFENDYSYFRTITQEVVEL